MADKKIGSLVKRLVEKEIHGYARDYTDIMKEHKSPSRFGLKISLQLSPFIGLINDEEKISIRGENMRAEIPDEYMNQTEKEKKDTIARGLTAWGKSKPNMNLVNRIYETFNYYGEGSHKDDSENNRLRRRMYTYQQNGFFSSIITLYIKK